MATTQHSRFDAFRRWINPTLRRLIKLELCRIVNTADGRTIGIGIRQWLP